MFCSNCGNQVSELNKFCSACGHKIIRNTKESATPEESNKDKETFVKRGKREMDDLADIVSSSKVAKNIASSKESISYAKEQTNNAFTKLMEILAIIGFLVLAVQIFRGFEGYWIITEAYRETPDIGYYLIRLSAPIIIPLILIYFGARHKKSNLSWLTWGGFSVLSWIMLLIFLTIYFNT
jgi:DNA-directed RNA polymerase subunit RPC12/RpoP